MNFWQQLVFWDQALFLRINRQWANPFFDLVMPPLRNSLSWAPLYVFLLAFTLINFRIRGLWWALLFLCTVALTDLTGNYVFKKGFERLRPCNDPDFSLYVRLLADHCGAGYSFISNHAANHFGMAAFFFVTYRHLLKNWGVVALVWAGLIGYAQIYVGVHYPLDVLCGALLGLCFGITMGSIFNKRFGFAIFDNQRFY